MILEFTQAVVDNANNTSLTPLPVDPICLKIRSIEWYDDDDDDDDDAGKMGMRPIKPSLKNKTIDKCQYQRIPHEDIKPNARKFWCTQG